MTAIPNVLAERYASPLIKDIWSPTGRIGIERDYWIAVMKAQRDLGLPIPAAAIADYEKAKGKIESTAKFITEANAKLKVMAAKVQALKV